MTQPLDGLEELGTGTAFADTQRSMLEGLALLQGLEAADIRTLGGYCKAYHARRGADVFREGERNNFMAFLVTGRVDILKQGKAIATIRPGRSMGEMSVIDGYPASATAHVVEDSELVLMTRQQFERLGSEHPALALRLYHALTRLISLRLRQTTGALVDYL